MTDFNKIEAVIFDFDGTLYCKKHFAIKLVFSSLINALKMKAERNVRHELKGKYFGNQELFSNEFLNLLSKKTGMSAEKARKWYYDFYIPRMVKILSRHYKAFPETASIFSELKKRGIKVVVFSDYCCVRERMSAIGVDPDSADMLFDAEQLGGLKPAKESFLKISEKLNVLPSSILVVGDREDTDGQGALNSGMQFILVQKDRSLATCFSQFLPD